MPDSTLDLVKTALNQSAENGLVQAITSLAVDRKLQQISFNLSLRYPSIPIIEIYRVVSGDQKADLTQANLVAVRFPILAGKGTKFTIQVADLTPGTVYWYKIIADGGVIKNPVRFIGTAATLQRQIQVDFSNLTLDSDGDNGSQGDDLRFYAVIYNGEKIIHLANSSQSIDLNDKTRLYRPIGRPFTVDRIPDEITLLCGVEEDDTPDFPWGGLDLDIWLPFDPPNPGAYSGATYSRDYAYRVIKLSGLQDTIGRNAETLGFVTKGKLAFTALWGIEIIVTDPFPTPRQVIARSSARRIVAWAGEAKRFVDREGKRGVLIPSAKGLRLGAGQRNKETWVHLEAPKIQALLIESFDAKDLELLIWNVEGALHYVKTDTLQVDVLPWQSLGGRFANLPHSLRDRTGNLHLFGVDFEGFVQYRLVGTEEGWNNLGGAFAGTVVACDPIDGSITVAVEDGKEHFWVRTLADDTWHKFPASNLSLLAVYADEIGDVKLLAVNSEGELYVQRLDLNENWEKIDLDSNLLK